MATPTLVKTWGYDTNNVVTFASSIEASQKLLWNLKEAMAAGGWDVVASSNKTSVKNIGDASPDLWAAYADVLYGSGTHSWVVLYNTTMDLSFIMDYLPTTNYRCNFYMVYGAVNADGTTSLKPTYAGAATTWLNVEVEPGRGYGATQFVWHSWYSSDDKAFRFLARSDGTSPGSLSFFVQEPSNAPDLWLDPAVYSLYGNIYIDCPWTDNTYYSAKTFLYARVNGVQYTMYISGESFYSGDTPAPVFNTVSPSDLSSSNGYLISPMGLIGDVLGIRGSNGRLDDMWWGPVAMVMGDTVMVSGSRDFIKIMDFLLPWNNTVPVLS